MKSRIWKLSSPESTSLLTEWGDSMAFDDKQCPIDFKHRGSAKRLTDLEINLKKTAIKDFIWTWYGECIIQDHVLSIFRENAITGFEVKPVIANIIDEPSFKVPRLWEIVVTGWGGIVTEETGIRLIKSCSGCGYSKYSGTNNPELLFNAKNWDGSDFFMLWPLPVYIFITEKVYEVINKNKLTGAKFLPIEKLKNLDGFSPGRLSYYMPEKRAKELGEPLDIY